MGLYYRPQDEQEIECGRRDLFNRTIYYATDHFSINELCFFLIVKLNIANLKTYRIRTFGNVQPTRIIVSYKTSQQDI